jgi:hypothetical protein
MKLTVKQALEVRGKLASFKTKDIPGVLSFKLARAFKPVREIAESFDDAQGEVVKKHGAPSATAAGQYEFLTAGKYDPTKYAAYETELKALMDAESEVELKDKLDQKEFEKLDLSMNEAEGLELFLA